MYATHDDIDAALVQAGKLISGLSTELRGMLHQVGMNDSMSELLDAAGTCWDWASLVFNRPNVEHVRAFAVVARVLEPCMAFTYYPFDRAFRAVEHQWPGCDPLCGQYVKLTERVRSARACSERVRSAGATGAGALRYGANIPEDVVEEAKDWSEVVAYFVLPVGARVDVAHVVRAQYPGTAAPAFVMKVISFISHFVGGLTCGLTTSLSFPISQFKPADLRALGTRVRRSAKCPRLLVAPLRPGDVARDRSGRCFHVLSVQQRVCIDKVTSSIVRRPWFSLGNGCVAWHAARLAHRCSMMFPPEAPCERFGSLLRLYWDPRRNLTPVDLADIALLAEAGVRCTGSRRDDIIIEQVWTNGKHVHQKFAVVRAHFRDRRWALRQGFASGAAPGAFCAPGRRGPAPIQEIFADLRIMLTCFPPSQVASLLQEVSAIRGLDGHARAPLVVHDEEERLAESGRFAGQSCPEAPALDVLGLPAGAGDAGRRAFLRERRQVGIPTELPSAAARSIRRHCIGGTIAPLPVDVKALHSSQRGAAATVLKEKTRAFWQSEAGADWRRERMELFGEGDAGQPSEGAAAAPGGAGAAQPLGAARGGARKKQNGFSVSSSSAPASSSSSLQAPPDRIPPRPRRWAGHVRAGQPNRQCRCHRDFPAPPRDIHWRCRAVPPPRSGARRGWGRRRGGGMGVGSMERVTPAFVFGAISGVEKAT